MRIDGAGPLANRVPEEDNDLAVLPDASGQSQTQADSHPTPPPEESTTLTVLARDSARLARHFDREPLPHMRGYRPVARAAAMAVEPSELRITTVSTPAANAPLASTPPAASTAAVAQTAADTPAPSTITGAPAATGYVGERPVDPQWLADREKTLVAIRADYTAARTQAQATAGVGPGWTVAATVTDESGQIRSASGRELVFVADPNAPQVVAGYDESGPIYKPNGQWMEFDEAAFAAHYRAQGSANLQSLASLYDTDVAGLFAKHPELWGIATSDHAINAGPPPAGRAMGDPAQLGMLDLYMQDPQMSALIDAYGGQPAAATSDIAREQVRIYGQQRYDQLSRLDNAMESVRNQYTDAMAQAQASGSGPGWVERARTVTVSDESGQTSTQTLYVTDESGRPLLDASGQPQAQMERIFDPDAFTAWYTQQGGMQHQAFKSFYGQSHSTYATDESGRTFASGISFDNANWSMYGVGGPMGHKDLIGINPNDPPRLHNRDAVGFDLEAGWATAHGNIKQKRDWFETVVQVAMVAVVSYVSAGTLGPAAAGAMGLSTTTVAGAMVSAAVAGAATSVASGMMSGNLSLKGVLQGALAGGLSAGLMTQLGPLAASAGPVGTIALRTTVQGGIQALLGGKFKDGALAGFAGSLADLASVNMQANIDKALADGTMTATQAASARVFARVMGSAIRAAGNPNDPAHAFGSAFLNDTLQQLGEKPVTQTAFDDEGNLMPGIVDPNATPEQQRAQLQAQLERQGLSAEHASALVAQQFDSNVAVSYPVSPGGGTPLPVAERNWEMTRKDDSGRVVEHIVSVGDSNAFHYRSDVDGQYTLTAGPNHALVRDTSGQLQLVSADAAKTGTWEVVVAPGQTVVTNGVQALALPANADRQAMVLASTLVAPLALPEGALLGEGALSGLGRLAIRLAPGATRLAGAAGLFLYSAPLGGGEQVIPFNENTRLVKPGGDVTMGHLELRSASGEWLRVQDHTFSEFQVRDFLATQRTSILSPEDIQRLTGPMINVASPPAGPGVISTPPLSPEDRELVEGPISTPVPAPAGPTIEVLPATQQNWRDLIVTSNEQNDSGFYGDIPAEHRWRYDRYLANDATATKLSPNEWFAKAEVAWANNAAGNDFEQAARARLGTPLGAGSKPVSIEGYVPDLPVGSQYGVTDIKNWMDLTNSDQLRAFHGYAVANNLPFNIIISPRTLTISEPVLDNIRSTGGSVIQYDPATNELTPVDIGKSGSWTRGK